LKCAGKAIASEKDGSTSYAFELSVSTPIKLKEWRHFVFKSPKRKNYKDLDKQVALFLKRESSLFRKQNQEMVEEGDWVHFHTTLLNGEGQPTKPALRNTFWLRVSTQHLALPFPSLFLGKRPGDAFVSDRLQLEESFQQKLHNNYAYLIEVKTICKGKHLCLDALKANFKLKSRADIHKKLIEVFSYRNDISQRKSIIEELFHLFFSKHRFEVPKHIVLRRQEEILLALKKQPDYQVYKVRKDFNLHVELLAEKQLKEEILIDQIAYAENVTIDARDIKNYLNLFNHERLREFVYFRPSVDAVEESTTPVLTSILEQATLREKTLNQIIHTLTK